MWYYGFMTGSGVGCVKWQEKRGMTLLEMLAVIAILAVLSAIAIPSVLAVWNSLLFQECNQHARTIFLSAQTRLTQMRSTGVMPEDKFPNAVPQIGDDAEIPPEGYVYASNADGSLYEILPGEMLEESLGEHQILLEFDPVSYNVSGVFFYRGEEDLAAEYAAGRLNREEAERRKRLLGYCDGSDLDLEKLEVCYVAAELSASNQETFSVTVKIPATAMVNGIPVPIMGGDFAAYQRGLEVTLTITGEQGGVLEWVIKPYGSMDYALGYTSDGSQAVCVTVTLDSLEGVSFADFGEILPGDNVAITAQAAFRPESGQPLVIIESAALAGVNPMFASLTRGKNGDILAVSQVRHLKNLNLVAAEIGLDVDTVLFTADGYTGEGKHGSAHLDLTGISFTPIANPFLFGSAVLTEEGMVAEDVREKSAEIIGNGTVISNLTLSESTGLVGLFAYLNGPVDGLFLENPAVTGDGASAVGALAGAVGENARISHCGVYLDTRQEGGSPGVRGSGAVGGLVGYGESNRKRGANVSDCFAAVPVHGDLAGGNGYTAGAGGLVGNAQGLRFQNCYASGTVTATGCLGENTLTWENNYLGLTESGAVSMGAGGFVGTGHGCRFESCFASGDVTGDAASTGGFIGVMCYDTRMGGQKTRFIGCYALGDGVFGNLHGHFSGVHAVIGEVPQGPAETSAEGILYKNTYYLSKYLPETEEEGLATGYCAKPVTYEALQFDSAQKAPGFTSGWQAATPALTHAYEGQSGVYPFCLQEGLPYYGRWPERPEAIALAYWETYLDTGETGYYVAGDDGLRTHAIVTGDGYAFLSSEPGLSVTVDGEAIAVTGKTKTIRLGQDAYYVFVLPVWPSSASYYSAVTAGGSTYWLNPNTALSQVTGEAPEGIPATVRIRSARQLAALGGETALWKTNYVQELDIDFSAGGVTHTSIAAFAGRYDGKNHTISGVQTSIFGTVEAEGEICNCVVEGNVVAQAGEDTGLLVGTMLDGTIENCHVSGTLTGRTGSGAIGGVVGRVQAGSLRNVTSTVEVSGEEKCVGTFVGMAQGGVFENCHTTGENDRYHFAGHAAEVASEPVSPDATHCRGDLFTKTTCTQEEAAGFLSLNGASHTKSVYEARFLDCTFAVAGAAVDVMCQTYYYRLEPLDAVRILPSAASAVPVTGTYLLVTEDGKVLCATESGSVITIAFTEGMDITPGMLWQAEENRWVNGFRPQVRTETARQGSVETTVTEACYTVTAELTLSSDGDNTQFRVCYQVQAEIRETGQEAVTQVTETGTAACDLYVLADSTDCRVIYVDERWGLTILNTE